MLKPLKPNLAVLPDQQRRLWPALADVPDSFVLFQQRGDRQHAVAGVPLPDGLGATRALFGNEFPPIEAVKALAYFDEGEAANVDPATRGYLARQAAAWDCTVSRIDKAAASVSVIR